MAALLPLALLVSLPLLILADTPSRPGKVVLSGENPWIFLNDKPDGVALTQVSFWRIHWSPGIVSRVWGNLDQMRSRGSRAGFANLRFTSVEQRHSQR